jgi:hypothetical protein
LMKADKLNPTPPPYPHAGKECNSSYILLCC